MANRSAGKGGAGDEVEDEQEVLKLFRRVCARWIGWSGKNGEK